MSAKKRYIELLSPARNYEAAIAAIDCGADAIYIGAENFGARRGATNTSADIHEKDLDYLATCRRTGRAAAKYYGWTVIECVRDGSMRSIEDIHEEIYRRVTACLED